MLNCYFPDLHCTEATIPMLETGVEQDLFPMPSAGAVAAGARNKGLCPLVTYFFSGPRLTSSIANPKQGG